MLKWLAGGAVSVFALRYLLRLNAASKTINTRTSVQVHRIGLSGLELKAQVQLQNPSPVQLNLQYPYVNVTYQGASIGSSTVRDEVINLPAQGEQSFSLDIRSAGWMTLIQLLGSAVTQKIRSGQSTTLSVVAKTTTRVNSIPYEQADKINLTI